MKRVATLWIGICLTGLLGQAWGQETDSLFFRPDSLATIQPDRERGSQPSIAQQHKTAESFMNARIHFTRDFIKRFTNQAYLDPAQRRFQIRSLFDSDDARFDRRQPGVKNNYPSLVDQFIEDVSDSPTGQKLADLNESLYADVLVNTLWHQQERNLTLYLKKTRTGTNWAWEVIGADAAFLLSDTATTNQRFSRPALPHRDSLIFIPPNAHELNFMGLAKQIRASTDLSQFISAASTIDTQLMAVVRNLANGQLGLQTIQRTTLWLNTQQGWLLQLRQFNRETDNSGWLISDLCRTNEATCLPAKLQPLITRQGAVRKP